GPPRRRRRRWTRRRSAGTRAARRPGRRAHSSRRRREAARGSTAPLRVTCGRERRPGAPAPEQRHLIAAVHAASARVQSAAMASDIVAVARALDFAARKHSKQRRKGEAGEPYVNHLAEVARLVAEATGGKDTVAVLAALLHDAIEDTPTTREELEGEFGREVAAVVAEVTDDKSLPKAERKRLQVETAPHKSARAKLIKIAD